MVGTAYVSYAMFKANANGLTLFCSDCEKLDQSLLWKTTNIESSYISDSQNCVVFYLCSEYSNLESASGIVDLSESTHSGAMLYAISVINGYTTVSTVDMLF